MKMKMKTEIIKQLKNSVWVVKFIDENGKVYVRFVSNSIVANVWKVKKVWADEYLYIEDKSSGELNPEWKGYIAQRKKCQTNKNYQNWLNNSGY